MVFTCTQHKVFIQCILHSYILHVHCKHTLYLHDSLHYFIYKHACSKQENIKNVLIKIGKKEKSE